MGDLLSSLNEHQRAAALHRGGPLIVLAGPGTGKTRAIIARIASLILNDGVAPETIVAVTYTVKAAQELRERLAEQVGPTADAVNAHTMHGFGRRLLRRFGDVLGLPADPELIDSAQTRRLLRSLVREHNLFRSSIGLGVDAVIDQARETFDLLRDAAIEPAEALRRAAQWRDKPRVTPETPEEALVQNAQAEELGRFLDTAALYHLFHNACRERGWLAFGDFISLPRQLLRDYAGKRAIIHSEYRHFVVDEFQDSNAAQIELLKLLAPGKSADLCVVGDDDQAIYGFRGADDRCFQMFDAAWPTRTVIELSQNYRSGPALVTTTNRVITPALRYRPEKVIQAAKETPASVECVELDKTNGPDDASVITAMILADRASREGALLSDYAVLARGHGDLDRIAIALELEGIPAIRVREQMADDPAVQDLLAWVQLLVEPEATAPLHRLLVRPPVGLDASTVATWDREYRSLRARHQNLEDPNPGTMIEWVAANKADTSPSLGVFLARHRELQRFAATNAADTTVFEIATRNDLAHADLAEPQARAASVRAVVAAVRFVRERQRRLDEPGDLSAFWSYFQDLEEQDKHFGLPRDRIEGTDEDRDTSKPAAVRLLTAHASKGLEFDTVFVVKVQSPHGFPKLSGEGPASLPAEIVPSTDTRDASDKRVDEERRLFYVACTRAQRRLVLLAPKLAKKSDSTSFFREVLEGDSSTSATRLWGPDVVERLKSLGLSMRSAQRSYGELDTSASETLRDERLDARRIAALALDRTESPALTREDLEAIARELAAAAQRLATAAALARTGQVPPWSTESHAAALLAKIRQAKPAHQWVLPRPPLELSYTSINDYIRCPRCWYVKHMLGLAESAAGSLMVGSIVHRSLEAHFRAIRDAESDGNAPPKPADLLAFARREIDRSHLPTQAVDGNQRDQIEALLHHALTLHEPDANILELERSVSFSYSVAGAAHRFKATLDRLDQHAGHMRVVDYKTGGPTKRLLEPRKDDLQLGIYALALREFLKTPVPPDAIAEYWVLATGQRGRISLADMDLSKVHKTIEKAVSGMLAGQFQADKDCDGLCAILGDAKPGVGPE